MNDSSQPNGVELCCEAAGISPSILAHDGGRERGIRGVGRAGVEPATLCLEAPVSRGLDSAIRDDWTAYLRFGDLVWRIIPSSSEEAPAVVVLLLQPLTTSLLLFGGDVQRVGDMLVLL